MILRVVALALLGALAGAASVVASFSRHPDFTLELDRDLAGLAKGKGFYEPERDGPLTFAWTRGRVDLSLPGADRRAAWTCIVRLRSARPPGVAIPMVDLAIDGITRASAEAPGDFQDITATAPARPERAGLLLTLVVAPTFVPNGSDTRELGVQVDRLSCRPEAGGLAWPPRAAITAAAIVGAIWGAVFGLTLATVLGAAGATVMLAIAGAIPLSTGPAPYSAGYLDRAVWIAGWIGCAAVAVVKLVEWPARPPLHPATRFAMLFSAAALVAKLLALLHPSKLVIDALFHAHRFEWVLGGRYYFPQTMPDGVLFPYAIGLYLFSVPWSVFTTDHVALLRVVVSASNTVAGVLLYRAVVRAWKDHLAGAVAVALFTVVPLEFGVVGNANLTNAFGQSAALATMVAVTVWPLGRRHVGQFIGLVAIATLALCSHVSTFGLLLAVLIGTGGFFWWLGGPPERSAARSVWIATAAAAVLSIALYYGHFMDEYKTLVRVRTETSATVRPPGEGASAGAASPAAAERPAGTSLATRAIEALSLTRAAIGWPMLLLGLVGLVRVWRDGARDRLVAVMAAWGLAFGALFLVGLLTPVKPGYERYAAEFIGRAALGTYPAAVLLAARGGAWAWRTGPMLRVAAAIAVAAALALGVHDWIGWME